MNPSDPAGRSRFRSRPRSRDTTGAAPEGKTGDVDQRDNKIAIAHTGTGDIVVSIDGETMQLDISAPRTATDGGSAASVPRTLPRDIPRFTGRTGELKALIEAVERAALSGPPVPVYTIEGMAGVGKTALAVHAAHRLTPRFSDGQMFMRLHAHSAGVRPVESGEALTALLRETGMDPIKIPASMEEREHLWRDRLASKSILLLLDDAAGFEQIRPLLPGVGGSAVMVTSRRRLEAFVGDVRVELDVLPIGRAAELFTRLSERKEDALESVSELVSLAGRLPLAIQLLAGRLRSRPHWSVADLVGELMAARDRSAAIGAADQPVSAAFDLCYNHLPEDRKQFFGCIGLHPGPDIDPFAAAAAAGVDVSQALRHLDALYADHLIEEHAKGRYRFHDLLADYARALGMTDPDAQDAATERLTAYYLYTAQAAAPHVARYPTVRVLAPEHPPRSAPLISTQHQADAWFEYEQSNLIATAEYGSENRPAQTASIAAAMADFLHNDGHWERALALHTVALAAAQRTRDPLSEAGALTALGTMQCLLSDLEAAASSFGRALKLYRAEKSQLGEANALYGLSAVHARRGDRQTRASEAEKALALFRAAGSQLGQANALNVLGNVQLDQSEYAAAADQFTQMLELCRTLGHERGQAHALTGLGNVHYQTGENAVAIEEYEEALAIYHAVGDQPGMETALTNLGNAQQSAGNYPAALATLSQALDLCHALGDREGELYALVNLANLQVQTGEHATARTNLALALDLCRAVGNQLAQAHVLGTLGMVDRQTGNYTIAVTRFTEALAAFRSLRDRHGEAMALSGLGETQYLAGDLDTAAPILTEALETFRDLGHRPGEAECLNHLGTVYRLSMAEAQARECHEQALVVARDIPERIEEARALEGLAECDLLSDKRSTADSLLRQALKIYQELGSPNGERVKETMRRLNIL